jgi:hypothetical protein
MLQIGRQANDDSVPGALAGQFEIRIDGTPRTYRDRKDYAMEAAPAPQEQNPHIRVEVKDLRSG